MSHRITLNPFANEPKADKAFEVTETVYPFRTKRVEANTAYYAAQKAFPATRFEHLTFRFIGRVIDVAVEAQKAETVRPPAVNKFDAAYDDMVEELKLQASSTYGKLDLEQENESCPLCYAYVPEACQSDLAWMLREQRQRDMAVRVASRLRRELAVEVTDPVTWVCLRQWSDELAGDQ